MAISTQAPGPYTAATALLSIMRRFREKGLTAPFTYDVLVRAGVSESLIPRTLQALQVLDLMDEKGMPTPTLQKIRIVPEKEYKSCIADWIKSAYAEVFQFVDPSKDDAQAVRDAFRSYSPIGQQDRMVALFYALCAEAGIVPESKKSSDPKPSIRKPQIQRSSTTGAFTRGSTRGYTPPPPPPPANDLPPALAGLMKSLPSAGTGWTKEKRDRFVETFKSVLDFVVPIVKHEPDEENEP